MEIKINDDLTSLKGVKLSVGCIKLPSASMQWKGTDICMDVYCECGSAFHIDGYFNDEVECPECKTTYKCGTEISLTKCK